MKRICGNDRVQEIGKEEKSHQEIQRNMKKRGNTGMVGIRGKQ